MGDALKWVNVVFAFAGSLAALGSLNKMRAGHTRPCLAAAMVLLAFGLAAQWLGEISGQWARIADTATYAGILALLLATQKVPTWFLERWANPIASIVAAIAGALLLAWLFTAEAHAAEAPPAEPAPVTLTLTADEAAHCARGGGCVVVTRRSVAALVELAQEAVRVAQEAEASRLEVERKCGGRQAAARQ